MSRQPDRQEHQDEEEERRFRGRRSSQHYIDEQIRSAYERGLFDELPGAGKPLQLDENPYAGENALGYSLLKGAGFAPYEIEMAKEIRAELAQAEARLARLRWRAQSLRSRRVPPFPSERHAFNATLARAVEEYEQQLRELNRKILTLNIKVPTALHLPPIDVAERVRSFRDSCPPL